MMNCGDLPKKGIGWVAIVGIGLGTLHCAGCSSSSVDRVNLMRTPSVYGDGILNPLPDEDPYQRLPYDGILFATDRTPAKAGDRERHYRNERGQLLRLGLAETQIGEKGVPWDVARRVSMRKSRGQAFPVSISSVDEWGFLEASIPSWIDREMLREEDPSPDATERFADAVNAQLAASEKKAVYIYVHGFNVAFEEPVLVSAELWHFLGYQGAFIAYSWPSTPTALAYIKDSDTSGGYARNLRLFIEFVAEQTEAEEVHILGFSNGTRLVARAIEQLALVHRGTPRAALQRKLRIRNVILVSSDIDRDAFGSYMADGLLDVPGHLTVYSSRHDKALRLSRFLSLRSERLGQLWGGKTGELHPQARQAIEKMADQISVVDVSDAERSHAGDGHSYFRNCPWVSSDVLVTLAHGLMPEERGLVKQREHPVFTFPPDYISRLREAIGSNPAEVSRSGD